MTFLPSPRRRRWGYIAGTCLLAFAAALPHSIAAAQTAIALTAAVWLAEHIASWKRPGATPLDPPILGFVLVSCLAVIFSLEPAVSASKLGSVALIFIIPVAADLLARSRRFAVVMVAVLLGSACVSALPVIWEKITGRGVDVITVEAPSPLARRIQPGDVLLSCDGHEIEGPAHFDQLLASHDPSGPLECQGLRGGVLAFDFKIPVKELPQESLNQAWAYTVEPGRRIRARGTYGHFVTYAEVMLQLAALACGLWTAYPKKWSRGGMVLSLVVLFLVGGLVATLTRASLAALVLALLAIAWMKLGWRLRLAAFLVAVLFLVGLNSLLVEWRGVGFYNPADLSMQYRRMMWQDGWRLIQTHPWLGIGMDSVLLHWQELGVRAYQQMHLKSHFHSTPMQIAVERGLLGLAAWLILMGAYLRLLVRLVERTRRTSDWWRRGLTSGILAASIGFLASGLVHYNFGDSEVVMVFWLLAGLAVALHRTGDVGPAPAVS